MFLDDKNKHKTDLEANNHDSDSERLKEKMKSIVNLLIKN